MRRLLPLLLAALLAPTPALACGGCFVPAGSTSPVLQDAERLLFLRDPQTKQSTVWVEVRYNGPSDDFGWVLPLPKVPKVGVGVSYLFDRLDLGTAPLYSTTSASPENCGSQAVASGGGGGCGAPFKESAPSAPTSATTFDRSSNRRRGVTVLEHDQVGPYDYVVLQGSNAQGLYDWLNARKYGIPEKAKPIIESHVQKGDVFVAVRLKTGASAQEVKPITLTMADAEPCVPLRLTAIAAVEDLTVEALLAGPGRAVPKNHLHVQINPLRINWFDGAANYGQVLSAAIDEAAGRAFATEFAGPVPAVVPVPEYAEYGGTLYATGKTGTEPLVDVAALGTAGIAKATDAAELLTALRAGGFPLVEETVQILEGKLGLAAQAGYGDKPVTWYRLADAQAPGLKTTPVDGALLAAELEEKFVAPLETVLPLLQAAPKLTRLVLRISPDEMTKDPVFAFHPGLPDVPREHEAQINAVCRQGTTPPDAYRLTLAGIGSYVINRSTAQAGSSELANNARDPRFEAAPAALVVELLDETGPAVPIHADDVDLVDLAIAGAQAGKPTLPTGLQLKPAKPRWTPPKSDATVGGTAKASVGVLLAAVVLALLLARWRAGRAAG